jgi:hypothetical protein
MLVSGERGERGGRQARTEEREAAGTSKLLGSDGTRPLQFTSFILNNLYYLCSRIRNT